MANLFRQNTRKTLKDSGKGRSSSPDSSPPGLRDLSLRADVVGSLQRGKDRVLKVKGLKFCEYESILDCWNLCLQDYKLGEKLGAGAFGVVRLATCRNTKRL